VPDLSRIAHERQPAPIELGYPRREPLSRLRKDSMISHREVERKVVTPDERVCMCDHSHARSYVGGHKERVSGLKRAGLRHLAQQEIEVTPENEPKAIKAPPDA